MKKLVIYLMAVLRRWSSPARPWTVARSSPSSLSVLGSALADGPVIRRAGERALARGMWTRACLDVLAQTRALVGDTPLVPMTYSSLLEAYGWERFAETSG